MLHRKHKPAVGYFCTTVSTVIHISLDDRAEISTVHIYQTYQKGQLLSERGEGNTPLYIEYFLVNAAHSCRPCLSYTTCPGGGCDLRITAVGLVIFWQVKIKQSSISRDRDLLSPLYLVAIIFSQPIPSTLARYKLPACRYENHFNAAWAWARRCGTTELVATRTTRVAANTPCSICREFQRAA